MFRAIHGIRDDDVSLDDVEARAAKRVWHAVATSSGLQLKKDSRNRSQQTSQRHRNQNDLWTIAAVETLPHADDEQT